MAQVIKPTGMSRTELIRFNFDAWLADLTDAEFEAALQRIRDTGRPATT
ncbi:hypothetical protein [Mycolicibacterium komossense]|uniref:CopG family transcriptional regulator n=1 Tax=Mycolicibacterium komossense TaxID=1779 RepID=A0ABT3CLT4_9MYCO|nr:hypothetical protein [Mycolicibacterium komossense]MCV7230420.1 hypothetical protein [Mycolicibacterium komossense]